jgi:hypothetical protein
MAFRIKIFPPHSSTIHAARRGKCFTRISFGHILLRIIIINFTLLIVQSCGLDIEDPTTPPTPVWVQKSSPEIWPERGIDAHEQGGIQLEWVPIIEEDVEAYLIYRAEYFPELDSLGNYEMIKRIMAKLNNKFAFIDADVWSTTYYYYKLRAENYSGFRSGYSDSLYYSILPKIQISTMEPNGIEEVLNLERELKWKYSFGIGMENYCLTILSQSNEYLWRKIFSPTDYVNGDESVIIPENIILDSYQVYKWRIDIGAKYFNGMETAGSESDWATFLYISE